MKPFGGKNDLFGPEQGREHGNIYTRGGESNSQLCSQRASSQQQVFEVGTPVKRSKVREK